MTIKIKTKVKYWYDFMGGWEFDADDDTGIFKDVEIDEKLIEKYNKVLEEYSNICERIRDVVEKR